MKKFLLTVLTAAACIIAAPATTATTSEICLSAAKKPKKEIKTVTFHANLHCHACVNKVQENIAFEKGVKDMKVDLDKHEITIKYDGAKTSVEKLAAAIEKLGYKVKVAE